MKLMYNPCNFDYFKSPDRTGEVKDLNELVPILKMVFEKIYKNQGDTKIQNDKIKSYELYADHPFFQKVEEFFVAPKMLDAEKAKCSEVFADYICKVARVTNDVFLEKILIFVTLFRECLNSQNKKEANTEYTEENNAEDAPDISNEFVTEYLETDENFFGFNKEEVIDITQNFCQWLYDNNFTCSKLSLISSL